MHIHQLLKCSCALALLSMLVAPASLSSQTIVEPEAKSIAERFFTKVHHTRSSASPASLTKIADSHSLSRRYSLRAVTTADPTFYIYAPTQGEGFVVVAGEEMGQNIIGYSFDSNIKGEIPPPMADYLADVDLQIHEMRIQTKGNLGKTNANNNTAPKEVLLSTAPWGQSAPFNDLCFTSRGEKAITGCVPTAYAILMHYYRWPDCAVERKVYHAGTGESIMLGHAYQWDNMLHDYSQGFSEEQAEAVATLMRDLGYAYEVDYGTSNTQSGSGGEGAHKLIDIFKYESLSPDADSPTKSSVRDIIANDALWKQHIRESLDEGYPIPYSAMGTSGRHIFILDGYNASGYYHFNWGWSGNGNGFFQLNNMKPDSSSDYSKSHRAYFKLRPQGYTNGIEQTEQEGFQPVIYSLDGKRFSTIQRSGIYIVGDKKKWMK